MENELEYLVVPGIDAAREAGRLLEETPLLWEAATITERRDVLVRLLDGAYVDMRGNRSVVSIKPKPAFATILESSCDSEELRFMANRSNASPLKST